MNTLFIIIVMINNNIHNGSWKKKVKVLENLKVGDKKKSWNLSKPKYLKYKKYEKISNKRRK